MITYIVVDMIRIYDDLCGCIYDDFSIIMDIRIISPIMSGKEWTIKNVSPVPTNPVGVVSMGDM